MKSFEGVLRRVDLGAGAWVLEGSDGRWLLSGAVPAALEGRRVRVTGRVTEGFGFAMTGDPTVEVGSIAACK
ncbi:MAG: hypothetical protein H0V89_07760 [Deltaproteobacteria bacterium]|nr:hypothetical protein [Deltaproteobacteria bacterium]